MAPVFDSAPRFWQGAPRILAALLIKGLPEPNLLINPPTIFLPFCPPLSWGRRVLRNDNGEA